MSPSIAYNTTANSSSSTLLPRHMSNYTERQFRLVFLWLIIAVGLIANSFIVAVIKIFRSMRTTTNYFLLNVAAADITTLIFTVIHLIIPKMVPFRQGALGSFLCKFIYTNNITMVTLLVTALTLTLLAVERYQAVVKPLITSRRIGVERVAYFIIGIWMVSIVMTTPLFVSVDCSPRNDLNEMRVYVTCLIVTLTLIPFAGIAFWYSKIISGLYCDKTICSRAHVYTQKDMAEKKRLLVLFVVLTSVFFVSFVPYGVVFILQFSGKESAAHSQIFARLRMFVQYLILLNCSLNPFIYAAPSSNYRYCLKYIVKKIFCRDSPEELYAIELPKRRGFFAWSSATEFKLGSKSCFEA